MFIYLYLVILKLPQTVRLQPEGGGLLDIYVPFDIYSFCECQPSETARIARLPAR